MPVIISVGLCQGEGLAEESQLQSNAALEVELELYVEPFGADVGLFQQQARAAFNACRLLINEESARREAYAATRMHHVLPIKLSGAATIPATIARSEETPQPVGRPGRDAPATTAQVAVIRSLARRDRGDGDVAARELDVRSLAELSVLEAAELIDEFEGRP